jgi:hypothetical protein
MEREYGRHIIVIANNLAFGDYENVERLTQGVRFSANELNRVMAGISVFPIDGRTFELPDFDFVAEPTPHWVGTLRLPGATDTYVHFARLRSSAPEERGTALLQIDREPNKTLEHPLSADEAEQLTGVKRSTTGRSLEFQLPPTARQSILTVFDAFVQRDNTQLARILTAEGVPQEAIDGYQQAFSTYLNFAFSTHLDWSQVTTDSSVSALSVGQHAYIDVPLLGVNGDAVHLVFDCVRELDGLHVTFEHMNA